MRLVADAGFAWHVPPEDEVELRARVARGASLLDEKRPGWWDVLGDIDYSDGHVLNQLYGGFLRGLAELGVDDANADHGFTAPFWDEERLSRMWRGEVERRQGLGPAELVTRAVNGECDAMGVGAVVLRRLERAGWRVIRDDDEGGSEVQEKDDGCDLSRKNVIDVGKVGELGDLVGALHMGGVTDFVRSPVSMLRRAVDRLTSCHDHVFVVDPSRMIPGAEQYVTIGVSGHGRRCLLEEFGLEDA